MKFLVIGDNTYKDPFIQMSREENVKTVFDILDDKGKIRRDFDMNEFDIVVFSGGEDVHPSFYGEEWNRWCGVSLNRDRIDLHFFEMARKLEKPMVGICRGIQWLCVMAGGKLWRHVEKHAVGELGHAVEDKFGHKGWINSYHHQMCRLPEDAELIAWASPPASDVYLEDKNGYYIRSYHKLDEKMDVEAAWFPNIKALGMQSHPERSEPGEYNREFFLWLIRRYILNEEIEHPIYIPKPPSVYKRRHFKRLRRRAEKA